jgi:thiol-disulfide isomerase/thioredoxin
MRGWIRAACLLIALCTVPTTTRAATAPVVGAPMPRFNLPAVSGTVNSDSLRGHIVYVDFWASWCDPCRRSFPWLRALHENYAAKGLVIVAINLDKDRAAAERFLVKYPAPFKVAFDPAGGTAEAFHVQAMPTSYLVGRDGRVLETHAGFDSKQAAAIEQRIQKECAP